MSDNSGHIIENASTTVSLESLYATMSQEADGFYKQTLTICTAFLGGSLAFFEKLFVSKATWSLWLLFIAWATLVYPLGVLLWVRWQNVEAHRHALEYFKTHDENEYNKAVLIPKHGRRWTSSAIVSMVLALVMIAVFTAINIFYK